MIYKNIYLFLILRVDFSNLHGFEEQKTNQF